jgi:hypothetical protein
LPSNVEDLKKERLERLKERMQKTLEDFELDIRVLDGIIMKRTEKIDRLQFKIPLVSYLPLKQNLTVELEELELANKADKGKYSDLKSEIATILSNMDYLETILNRFAEAAELFDE